MCNPNSVSGFLAGAKIPYAAAIIMLSLAIFNSASFFAAAANITLMAAVITFHALSITLYAFALAELDKCASGPCTSEFRHLRTLLAALIGTLSGLTALLIAAAIVAAIPFAGAVTVAGVLGTFVALTAGAITAIEYVFARALDDYNNCRTMAGLPGLNPVVRQLTIFAAFVSFALFAAGIVGVAGMAYK